ncbi:MAG: Crp/Fnr family transcriptional regulator [Rhodobacter sp.]|nr:Crp/Fnr family transcriptional regulator [Rhodobacter sp.]
MATAGAIEVDPALRRRLSKLTGATGSPEVDKHGVQFTRNARDYKAGQAIAFEGEEVASVLCVLDGWISLSKTLEDGERQIIDFGLPGDIVTAVAADGTTSCLEVDALTDVTVAALSHADWERRQSASPELREMADHLAAASHARLSERMLRLGKGSAPVRIAYALLELCVRLRSIGQTQDHTFHLPLTQQHLGEFTGLSSVHVCRTLRRLSRQQIIQTEDHLDIKIIDLAALSGIAGIGPDRLQAEIVPAPMPTILAPGNG